MMKSVALPIAEIKKANFRNNRRRVLMATPCITSAERAGRLAELEKEKANILADFDNQFDTIKRSQANARDREAQERECGFRQDRAVAEIDARIGATAAILTFEERDREIAALNVEDEIAQATYGLQSMNNSEAAEHAEAQRVLVEKKAKRQYKIDRSREYPSVKDQIGALMKAADGDDTELKALLAQIAAVKSKFPKPE